MEKYEILQTFKGSQDGRFTEEFTAGDKDVGLSDSLAEVAVAEKWAKPMKPAPRRRTKTKEES